MTDAVYEYRKSLGADVDAAIVNAGVIRASIDAGNITRGELLTAFSFMNGVGDLVWSGRQILDIFEGVLWGGRHSPITRRRASLKCLSRSSFRGTPIMPNRRN
jgi:hypothetical protein